MSANKKVIVLTPVKNEAWILDRFLQVTSQFADHIIIADQGSTDGSLEIAKKYPKVILAENKGEKYDEASRQQLLLGKARDLYGIGNVLLALDADEIMAGNAIESLEWKTMINAPVGTLLCFEKPELYQTPQQSIRYNNTWPLGYVDDGAAHKPSVIHSIRIPTGTTNMVLHLHDIKILHYAMTRIPAQKAKLRMYSVIENINQTKSLRLRRRMYHLSKDWTTGTKVEKSDPEWFRKWEILGIDMTSISDSNFYWQDLYVLKTLEQYGSDRFHLDDIWDINWRTAQEYFTKQENESIKTEIRYPAKWKTSLLKTYDKVMGQLYKRL